MRTVGILGGMGPEATILLMRRVLDAVDARDDADHVPLLVDQNPQVPSRLAFLLEGRGEDPGPVLAAMARRLAGAGAEALAMPCNTAHHWAGAIREAAGLPLLDMVALAAARAAALGPEGGRVGLLASPAVARVGLYEPALAAHGLTALHPADAPALVAAIRAVKAEGPTDAARATLRAASRGLLDRGARVQVVACTEFSLLADATAPGAAAFDSLDALAEAVVAFARTAPAGPS